MLRRSNLVPGSTALFGARKHLRRKDVEYVEEPYALLLTIHETKMLQFKDGDHTIYMAGSKGAALDPVRLWQQYVASHPAAPDAAMFSYNDSQQQQVLLTISGLAAEVKELVGLVGLDPRMYATHSLWRGVGGIRWRVLWHRNSSSGIGDCSRDVDEMQTAGSSKAPSLQQLLTAPITRMFPRFLWTRQNLSVCSVTLSCQLFDRLQGATVAMKLPVQVHVVVQPEGWDCAQYLLSRAPQQQPPVIHSNSSMPEAVGAPGAGWAEVPAAALPTAAAGPGSIQLGPFTAYVSRNQAGGLRLVEIKDNSQLKSYRSVAAGPDAHDIVLFEQVDECTMVLHLQHAPANRSAARPVKTSVAAGQAMGLQVFPYTYPCVACQESTTWIPMGFIMRLDSPKLLILSQLPQLHHNAAAFPLPVCVRLFETSNDGNTPAVPVSIGSISAELARHNNGGSTRFQVAAPATGAVAALQGRRVLRMALTPDYHLGVLMGPAGSYTPSSRQAAKRRRDESASTAAPLAAAADNHSTGNKSSKTFAAGMQQPQLPAAAVSVPPPASPSSTAAAASCEQCRPTKKSKLQVQAAQDDAAAAAMPEQLDAGDPAVVPAAAAAAPKKEKVKQQEENAIAAAPAAAAAASEPVQKQKKRKHAAAEVEALAQQQQCAGALASAAAATAAATTAAQTAHKQKQHKQAAAEGGVLAQQQQQQECAEPLAPAAAATTPAEPVPKKKKKKHKQAAAEGEAQAQQQRKKQQHADPQVALGDAAAAADAAPGGRKKSSKKRQAAADPTGMAEGEGAGTVQLQPKPKKQHQQSAAAEAEQPKQKKKRVRAAQEDGIYAAGAAAADQPKEKQKKKRDRAAAEEGSGAAAKLLPRKLKGQQHDPLPAAAAAADTDAAGTAGRKKRRKAAAADPADSAAGAAAESDGAAEVPGVAPSGSAAVQDLIQQQLQWVEEQEQWVEKQQRRLAKQQQQLAAQKAQLQAQLIKPSKRKKKKRKSAAAGACGGQLVGGSVRACMHMHG